MKYIIMIGLPGAGKGTQSALLAERCNLKHLSTGDILRKEIGQQSELGKIAEALINEGNFVPDDITLKMVEATIEKEKDNVEGFILDGFPRTIPQAVAFEKYLENTNGKLLKVFCLDVPPPIAMERLIRRGKQSDRKDDNEAVAHKRIEIYYQTTYPLIDYYDQEDNLAHVNGEEPIEEVTDKLVSYIQDDISCI